MAAGHSDCERAPKRDKDGGVVPKLRWNASETSVACHRGAMRRAFGDECRGRMIAFMMLSEKVQVLNVVYMGGGRGGAGPIRPSRTVSLIEDAKCWRSDWLAPPQLLNVGHISDLSPENGIGFILPP